MSQTEKVRENKMGVMPVNKLLDVYKRQACDYPRGRHFPVDNDP